MKRLTFLFIALSFCLMSCGDKSNTGTLSSEESVKVVEELDSTTQVLNAVKDEIESSNKELDQLLNDLN